MSNIYNFKLKSWSEKYKNKKVDISKLYIHSSWRSFFENEFKKDYFKKIEDYLSFCLKKTNGNIKIFPYPDNLFTAFNYTPFNKLKVVILGQDPYHNYIKYNNKIIPQANGLSFSVPIGMKIPSSLNNIFKNLLKYKHIKEMPKHGNLFLLALQGFLFLNTSLTVQCGHPNSHSKKWELFTDNIIKYINREKDNIIFILWGSNALKKKKLIDENKHKIIISSHPSGLSCYKKLGIYNSFSETDHFKKINYNLNKSIVYNI